MPVESRAFSLGLEVNTAMRCRLEAAHAQMYDRHRAGLPPTDLVITA